MFLCVCLFVSVCVCVFNVWQLNVEFGLKLPLYDYFTPFFYSSGMR